MKSELELYKKFKSSEIERSKEELEKEFKVDDPKKQISYQRATYDDINKFIVQFKNSNTQLAATIKAKVEEI